jgi:hypothetical protein
MAKPPSNAAIIQRGLSSAKAGGEGEKSTQMKRMEDDREDKNLCFFLLLFS